MSETGVDAFFHTVEVPNAQAVYGNALPLGLQLKRGDKATATPELDDSFNALRSISESGELGKLLQKHGAILLRGLGDPSADTFSKLVNVIEGSRGSQPYIQIGLAGKRTSVAENVWTANEGPENRRFYQHNEYSRYTRFPANIHFYCVKKAEEGGETPIAHSALVFEKLKAGVPELVDEVQKRGLAMKMLFRAPGNEGKDNEFNWAGPFSFGQEFTPGDNLETKKAKVEKQVRKLTHDFRWTEDGSIELTQHIPGIRREPANDRPVWFNGLVGRFGITRDIGALEHPYIGRDGMTYLPSVYGDGTPIPREYLEKLAKISEGLEINLSLEEGDLLLVDNFQVSHGRKPWKGERRILVSMWEGAASIREF